MKYVIIGGGVAGTTAAANIRKIDSEGEITIVTNEAYPFYSRMRLIEFPLKNFTEKGLIIRDIEWYKENKIVLIMADGVLEIDKDKKEVVTISGKRLGYDKVLLATGGRSFVPPIPGADKPGVFTLRTMKDALTIKEHVLSGNNKVVIIGGGLLGLEVANNMRKADCDVSIVEFFPRLLPRQMDPAGSEILKAQIESLGFSLFLEAQSQELVGENNVEALILKDG
ncbi:MAG: NAD(P)/FAD-dependent oxidoreductase, partial [bacterium]